jgi:hypothetical protein
MGDSETVVERTISSQQYVLDCEGRLEEVKARWVGAGVCEEV